MKLSDFELAVQCGIVHEEQYKDFIKNSASYRWMNGNECVASVTIEEWKNGWTCCYDLMVSKEYQGKGLGNQLVKFIVEKGVNHLSVDIGNDIAIHLYKKYGFFFSGGWEGCLARMERLN